MWLFYFTELHQGRRWDIIFDTGFCRTNSRRSGSWDASYCCLWGSSRLKQRKSEFSRRMARNCSMHRKYGRSPIRFFPMLFCRLRGSFRFLWAHLPAINCFHELSNRIRQILRIIANSWNRKEKLSLLNRWPRRKNNSDRKGSESVSLKSPINRS
jgi:hypothetical protein